MSMKKHKACKREMDILKSAESGEFCFVASKKILHSIQK